MTLTVFFVVKKHLKNYRMVAHSNLSIALLCLHTVQLISEIALKNDLYCILVTILSHLFVLATFMWMFVEGFFLYLNVVQVFIHSRLDNKVWMYILGWGCPLVIGATSASIGMVTESYIEPKEETRCSGDGEFLFYPQGKPQGKYEICWLSSQSGMRWSFLGPALFIIIFNFVILAKVVQVLIKSSKRKKNRTGLKASSSVRVSNSGTSTSNTARSIIQQGFNYTPSSSTAISRSSA